LCPKGIRRAFADDNTSNGVERHLQGRLSNIQYVWITTEPRGVTVLKECNSRSIFFSSTAALTLHFVAAAKEREMEIGCPTDVKHVAHIGWGSSSMGSASPSWVKTDASIQHNTTGFMFQTSECMCCVR
jgi:hypothetical protein